MNYKWKDMDASSFYRIIMPPVAHEGKLELPKKFVKEYSNELSNPFIKLSVPSGGIWHVGIERAENMVWLHHGWQRFAQHHSINWGYFLLFKYKGNSEFDVSIFDLTAAEIEYPCSINYTEKMFIGNGAQATVTEQDVFCGVSRDQPIEISESSDKEEIRDVAANSRRTSCSNRRKSRKRGASDGVKISDSSDKIRHVTANSRMTSRSSTKKSRKRWDTEEEKMWELHIATRVFKSDNPYFTWMMRSYNLERNLGVHVPAEFSRTNLRGIREYIVLQDSDNKEWRVGVIMRRGRIISMSKGWSIFAKEKELGVGDVCIFEVIKSTRAVLKVSVFRAKERAELM